MVDFDHLDSAFELKNLAESGVFEGYAAVFDVTDSVNDVMAPGAFAATLAAARDGGRLPPLLWQHDAAAPIGAWRDMREDAHGLYVKGELFLRDIPKAREAYKLLRENVVTGLSIGYRTKDSRRDEKTGARRLTSVELLEVSMVTFPANDHARVRRVKSLLAAGEVPGRGEVEAFLRDAGFSRPQAEALLARGYGALDAKERPQSAGGDDITAAIERLAATIRNSI